MFLHLCSWSILVCSFLVVSFSGFNVRAGPTEYIRKCSLCFCPLEEPRTLQVLDRIHKWTWVQSFLFFTVIHYWFSFKNGYWLVQIACSLPGFWQVVIFEELVLFFQIINYVGIELFLMFLYYPKFTGSVVMSSFISNIGNLCLLSLFS